MVRLNADYLATGLHTDLDDAISTTLRRYSAEGNRYVDETEIQEDVRIVYGHELEDQDLHYIGLKLDEYISKSDDRQSRYFEHIPQEKRIIRAHRIARMANCWARREGHKERVEYSESKDAYHITFGSLSDWYGPNGLAGAVNSMEFLAGERKFFPLAAVNYYADHRGRLRIRFSVVQKAQHGELELQTRWGVWERTGFKWER